MNAASHDEVTRIHLVLRFADNLFGVGNVIERHKSVVRNFGAVWFGKIGQPIGQATSLRLLPSPGGSSSYLFLVKSSDRRNLVFRSQILDIQHEAPGEDSRLVPPYYDEFGLVELMKSWIKIGAIEQQSSQVLTELSVVSSGRVVRDALRRSMTGSFVVQEVTH